MRSMVSGLSHASDPFYCLRAVRARQISWLQYRQMIGIFYPDSITNPRKIAGTWVYNAITAVIHPCLTQNGTTDIFRRDVKDVYVTVRDNNVDQALRVLKKKMQREGVFREMKNRRSYEKPSERRAREAAESTRRVRKLMRKRLEREGY